MVEHEDDVAGPGQRPHGFHGFCEPTPICRHQSDVAPDLLRV